MVTIKKSVLTLLLLSAFCPASSVFAAQAAEIIENWEADHIDESDCPCNLCVTGHKDIARAKSLKKAADDALTETERQIRRIQRREHSSTLPLGTQRRRLEQLHKVTIKVRQDMLGYYNNPKLPKHYPTLINPEFFSAAQCCMDHIDKTSSKLKNDIARLNNMIENIKDYRIHPAVPQIPQPAPSMQSALERSLKEAQSLNRIREELAQNKAFHEREQQPVREMDVILGIAEATEQEIKTAMSSLANNRLFQPELNKPGARLDKNAQREEALAKYELLLKLRQEAVERMQAEHMRAKRKPEASFQEEQKYPEEKSPEEDYAAVRPLAKRLRNMHLNPA